MYTLITVVMLAVGVTMIVTSLILMVVWRVPDLFDELTGKKAKRQIKALRDANIGTGAFDVMSTGDITNLANQEFSRQKARGNLGQYEGQDDGEEGRAYYSNSGVDRHIDDIDENDIRVGDIRVAEVEWVLLEEASSIFK